jgi:hypothetical protein
MECRDAQFYLLLKRHAGAPGTDELGPEVQGALAEHCAGCPACAADARAAAAFDRALATAMSDVPVPAGLHARLLANTGARAATARRARVARAGALALAACALALIGLGAYARSRPVVDTDGAEGLAQVADRQSHFPEGETSAFLARNGAPPALPLPFEYGLHVFNGYERVGGRDVPVVVFHSPTGRGTAVVYVFAHNGRFNLDHLREAQVSGSRVQVFPGQGEFKGFTYVVLTKNAEDVQQFLRAPFQRG